MAAKTPRPNVDDVLSNVTFKPTSFVRKPRAAPVVPPVPQIDPVLWETYVAGTPSSVTVPGRMVNDTMKLVKDSRRFLAQREKLDLRLTIQLVEDGTDTTITDRPVKADEPVEIRFQLRPPLNRGVRARQTARSRRKRRTTR